MASFTALARASGAIRPGVSSTSGAAPAPHFDSILRAAPAYDADDTESADSNEDLDLGQIPSSSLSDPPTARESTAAVAEAIRPHLAHHSSLHAYLDANRMLEEMMIAMRQKIHEDSGRLKSRIAELKRMERVLAEAQEVKGKGAVLWLPKKKRLYRMKVEKAIEDRNRTQQIVNDLERDLLEEKRHLVSLEQEMSQYKRVEARLDALDTHVFGGLTPAHPEEDRLEQEYHILLQTARRIQASVQLEKRAQQHLTKAYTLCQTMTKELLKALNVGIEIGVASNVKHKNQLFVGTSPISSARASRGSLLRAKTLCGDLHTHYISARAVQTRIAKLPKLEVIELTRLPDQRGKQVLNEVGLHRALEASYAESKIAQSHIEKELQKGKARQKKLKEHIGSLETEARSVWLTLRTTRRSIIDDVRTGELADNADQTVDIAEAIGGSSAALESERAFDPSVPPSAEVSQRPSLSSSLPPPYRRELASQSSLGIAFPPLDSTPSGTLASFAAPHDWHAREQHRLLALPHAFRHLIDRESIARSRALVTRVAVEVGGVLDDDDLEAVGQIDTPAEEDLPGLHLVFS